MILLATVPVFIEGLMVITSFPTSYMLHYKYCRGRLLVFLIVARMGFCEAIGTNMNVITCSILTTSNCEDRVIILYHLYSLAINFNVTLP